MGFVSRVMLFVGIVVQVGCVPSCVQNTKDQSVLDRRNYRQVNSSCADMNLAESAMDVPTLRAFVSCLNNSVYERVDGRDQGPIQAIADLIGRLPDPDVQVIASQLNKDILNNARALFEIENTHQLLVNRGILEEALEQFGVLISNKELISSSLVLLADAFDLTSADPAKRAQSEELLRVVQILGRSLDVNDLRKALELGVLIFDSPAFRDLWSTLGAHCSPERPLSMLVPEVLNYLKERHTYDCDATHRSRDIKSDLFEYVLSPAVEHPLFGLLDSIVGTNTAEVQEKLPRLVALFQAMLQDSTGHDESGTAHPSLLKQMATLFPELNKPISCVMGSATVPNGVRFLIDTIAHIPGGSTAAPRFVLQTLPLELMTMGPMCTFPDRLTEGYRLLIDLAKMGLTIPGVDLPESAMVTLAGQFKAIQDPELPWRGCASRPGLHGAHEESQSTPYHPLATFAANLLSDQGGYAPPAVLEVGGIVRLIPLLAELSHKGVLPHALLVLSGIDTEGQTLLENILRFLIKPQPDLTGQKSILDVLTDTLLSQTVTPAGFNRTSAHLIQFLHSLDGYSENGGAKVAEALKTLRKAYYVNDVHPFLDLLLKTMREAPENGPFYTLLFKISQMPEFERVIALMSKMSEREDGRLKSLLGANISLFHRFAQEGGRGGVINETDEPLLSRARRHQLNSTDLVGVTAARDNIRLNRLDIQVPVECTQMDFNLSIADLGAIRVEGSPAKINFERFLACYGADAPGYPIHSVVNYLTDPLQGAAGRESLFQYLVRIVNDLTSPGQGLGQNHLTFLLDQVLNPDRYAMMTRFVKTGNLFIVGNQPDAEGLPLLDPLLRVILYAFSHAHLDIEALQSFAADQIVKPSFPVLLRKADDLLGKVKVVVDERATHVIPDPVPPVVSPAVAEAYAAAVERAAAVDRELFPEDRRVRARALIQKYECKQRPGSEEWVAPTDAEVEDRLAEIMTEAKGKVSVTELEKAQSDRQVVDGSVHEATPSVSRQKWTLALLEEFIEPAVNKLSNRTESDPNRWILDAYISFLKRFQPGNPYGYTPEMLIQWLRNSSTDFQPVVLLPHGWKMENGRKVLLEANRLEVSLMSTLQKLDRVLYETIFSTPLLLGKTLSHDFLHEIADAWGDEPQAFWPPEIQALARAGTHIRTLREAIADILDRRGPLNVPAPENLGALTFVMGLRGYDQDATTPPCYQLDVLNELRSRVFNLGRLKHVLIDQVPIPGNQSAQGMRFLRDLFFEVYYSSPRAVKEAGIPAAQAGNNLVMIDHVVRMGALTQLGKFFQYVNTADPAVHTNVTRMVQSMIDLATSDEATALLRESFTQVPQNPAQPNGPKKPTAADRAWSVVKVVLHHPESQTNLDLFQEKLDELTESEEYRQIDFTAAKTLLLDFLKELPTNSNISRETAVKLRAYVARRLQSGDLVELLRFIGRNPTGAKQMLRLLGDQLGEQGSIEPFLDLVRRGLTGPVH